MKKANKKSEIGWFWIVFILAFILSIVFSVISSVAITKLPIIPAIIILLAVIFIGILFDIIGVAVTVANEEEFHAMASKKLRGAKSSINLIKNSSRVANVCADVVGDVCGVISGAIAATISMKIMSSFQIPFDIQAVISALVASLTIGGKAIGKSIANNNSTGIIKFVGKVVNIFKREK